MENMELSIKKFNSNFWRGRRVFLTGHTGFKGGWLSLWLHSLGAEVFGFALSPDTKPSLFKEARINELINSAIGDIRDFELVRSSMLDASPEIIIHMAAQPLVRQSYKAPIETYETNVMGTVHVLEAAREIGSLKTIINVTSDKCYENKEWDWGYRETDSIGGFDPYSSSKGCSELITSAYRNSFFQNKKIGLASVRAGNVVGGGDWSSDRLIPDLLRAFESNVSASIRNSDAIRPWQHVLEPLSGYLELAQKTYQEPCKWSGAWNFGPSYENILSVGWVADYMKQKWGGNANWHLLREDELHEARILKLDISKSITYLDWRPKWHLAKTLDNIIQWHKIWLNKEDARQLCLQQIDDFLA